MTGVDAWNVLSEEDAAAALRRCCGSAAWARRVVARRPFADLGALLDAADEIWKSLGEEDWLEAFAHHPRIGERDAAVPQDAVAAAWSAAEQSGVERGAEPTAARMAAGNREYERRFGFIFLICAAGRSGEEILVELEARLGNERQRELRIAAEEQRKITHLRLERLFGVHGSVRR